MTDVNDYLSLLASMKITKTRISDVTAGKCSGSCVCVECQLADKTISVLNENLIDLNSQASALLADNASPDTNS